MTSEQKAKRRAQAKAYRATPEGRMLERLRNAKYRAKHKTRRKQTQKAYRDSHKSKLKASGQTYVTVHWAKSLLKSSRKSSKSRGHSPPTITEKDLLELWTSQKGLCFWSEVPLGTQLNHPFRVSLDRIDNSKGYEPGNILLCTWVENRARMGLSFDEYLLVIAARVAALQRKLAGLLARRGSDGR